MRVSRLSPLVGALVAFTGFASALVLPSNNTAAANTTTAAKSGNPNFPNPNDDPFYKAPESFGAHKNGDVLRRRSIPPVAQYENLGGAYQLYYQTETTQGGPQGTVATIFVPEKPASPPKIVSVQWFQDSVSFDCAPSFALVKDSGSANAISAFLDNGIYNSWALKKGYYVVVSDHEGPNAAFIAGFNSGKAVLDGIRAIINDQKLPKDTKVAMTGYSGGAHATVWAETLAESHAPELNIVGSVHGGTPIDLKGTLDLLEGNFYAGFAFAGIAGVMTIYPDLKEYIYSIITDKGREVFNKFTSRGFCLPNVVLSQPFQRIETYTNSSKPFDHPIAVKYFKAESLLMSYSSNKIPVPKFPRLLYHGLLDEIVPYDDEAQYVKEQCEHGANIQFKTLFLAEHITAQLFGVPGNLNFLEQALEGKIPKVVCGSVLPDFNVSINDPKADQIMGKDLAQQARSLSTQKSPFSGSSTL